MQAAGLVKTSRPLLSLVSSRSPVLVPACRLFRRRSVSVLAEGPNTKRAMRQLARPFAPGEDRLAGLETKEAGNGCPILSESASYLECEVISFPFVLALHPRHQTGMARDAQLYTSAGPRANAEPMWTLQERCRHRKRDLDIQAMWAHDRIDASLVRRSHRGWRPEITMSSWCVSPVATSSTPPCPHRCTTARSATITEGSRS